MRKKALSIRGVSLAGFAVVVCVVSLISAFEPTAASAAPGDDRYSENGYYMNAWGGGHVVNNEPQADVDAFAGSNTNDNFEIVINSLSPAYANLYYDGPGVAGPSGCDCCIGDLNNDPHNARAELQPCSEDEIPWGGNFKPQGCTNGDTALYDPHWGGYLAPSANSNGAAFYLNHNGKYCFHVTAAP